MYHVIGVAGPDTPNIDLWVSPTTFAKQVRWLARHRFSVVSLQEVFDYWHGAPLPRKPVVLSFDDGFRSDYGKAMPILAKYGWAGTLNFALSHYPDELNRHRIRGLLASDWELDSHTLTLAYLPGLSDSRLHDEVAGSRRILRRRFHVPVNFFCYPYGAFDSRVVSAVQEAGYAGATTTQYGFARPGEPYTLDRIRISHSDGVSGFARKLG